MWPGKAKIPVQKVFKFLNLLTQKDGDSENLERCELQRFGLPGDVFDPLQTLTSYERGRSGTLKITRAWRKALIRAGIDNFRWHDLRHTWATWQRQAGTPTHELQRLGGWRTGAMVEGYAHLAPDHLAEAASRLNSVLSGYDSATVA